MTMQQLPGVRIEERRVLVKHGSEGPAHDPYSFTEYTLRLNGESCTLHTGLGCWIEVNGTMVLEATIRSFMCMSHDDDLEALVIATFEEMVGTTVEQLDRAHHRSYEPDPMGSPSQYI